MRRILLVLLTLILSTQLLQAQGNTLQIGGSAQVYVQDDGLKLRAGPGVSNPVVEVMPSGTIVEVIGGPSSDGTYVWWNLRTPSGNEGWAVESANGIQTLIPYTVVAAEGVEVVSSFQISDSGIPQMVWSPDDARIALVTQTALLIYDVAAGTQLLEVTDLPVIAPALAWSSDGRWLQMTYEGSSMGYVDTQSGDIASQTEVPGVEWLAVPDMVRFIARLDFQTGQNVDNRDEVVIQHAAGTLTGDNPARFDGADGSSLELGNGGGGIAWRDGSSNVLIWSDANSDPSFSGSAEVWDITTGQRRALVPHGSINLFAQSSFSDPAFLSNDETLLAAVTTDLNSAPVYTVTLYRLTD